MLVALAVAISSALLLATAAPVLASCLPPRMQTLDDPGLVVVSGTVSDLTDDAVGLVVDQWWGDHPRSSVAVRRPATDPTVISSTDWSPALGERWLVAGHIAGDMLVTDVCLQWPATAQGIAEVVRSRGDATTPGPGEAAASTPGATAGTDASSPPSTPPATLVLGAVAIAAASGALMLVWLRRRVV
jgi:hypothetical protein